MDDVSSPTPPPMPGTATGESIRVEYRKAPGLLSISLVNFFLNVITLGIYRFWAKTRVRRHIWGSIHVNNEPVEYTGTGKELFLGFLVIFLVIFLPISLGAIALSYYYGPESPVLIGYQLLITLLLVCFYGFAIYRARRYRLSRTVWRGIRAALPGSALAYSGKYLGALILNPMTMGWSRPAMNLILAEQMYNDMRFGNQPFSFRGRSGPLYARYALCWFLMLGVIIALIAGGTGLAVSGVFDNFSSTMDEFFGKQRSEGEEVAAGFAIIGGIIGLYVLFMAVNSIVWSLYTARELNVFTSYTTYPGLRFSFNATAGSLITLWLGNMAIIIFTLGILSPYAEQRVMRYFVERIAVDGQVDFAAIKQSQAAVDSRGEGLIDALDLDAF